LGNPVRQFDRIQIDILGKYVYVLIDPRDKYVFYVGQGTGNRVFSHFNEAESKQNTSKNSSKINQILDIWKDDKNVDWTIVAHNLDTTSGMADMIESSIYDSLSISKNKKTLNEVSPPKSTLITNFELKKLKAIPVNPQVKFHRVFIFPVQKGYFKRGTIYEATRMAWYIKDENQKFINSYAVGLRDLVSIGSFKIEKWIQSKIDPKKHEFLSLNHPIPSQIDQLKNRRWNKIIEPVKGYWQRGQYLIIEFDGKGKFKYIRGKSGSNEWYDCD